MREPRVPDDICAEAQEYVTRVIQALKEQDVLTALDFSAIEQIGYVYHTWREATKVYLKEGLQIKSPRGEMKAHPCVKMALDARIQIDKFETNFGLNLKSRKEIGKSKDKEKELSPIDKFISGTKEVR